MGSGAVLRENFQWKTGAWSSPHPQTQSINHLSCGPGSGQMLAQSVTSNSLPFPTSGSTARGGCTTRETLAHWQYRPMSALGRAQSNPRNPSMPDLPRRLRRFLSCHPSLTTPALSPTLEKGVCLFIYLATEDFGPWHLTAPPIHPCDSLTHPWANRKAGMGLLNE
jgi:hypothetical protein